MLATEHDWRVSRYEGYVRESEIIAATADGGNLARRAASLALAGAGLALLLLCTAERRQINLALAIPLVAGLGWCALSMFWSIDPGMCLRRLIVLGCYLVCAAGLARAGSPIDIARLCAWLGLGSLAMGLLVEFALGTFRPWGSEYRFAGTLHPNAQGAYLAAGAIATWMLADNDRVHRRRWLVGCLVLVLFVALTKSRTSFAALAAAIGCMALLRTSFGFKLTAGLTAVWLAATGLLAALVTGLNPQSALVDAALLGRKEQAESLTGRSEIWEEVIRYIALRPWTGYGYESFWTEDHIRRIADNIFFTIISAHSGYLELILSVGIVGLTLYLTTLLVGLVQTAHQLTQPEGRPYSLLLGLIIFALFCSTMESTMVTPNSAVLILAACLAQFALYAPRKRDRRECSLDVAGRRAYPLQTT